LIFILLSWSLEIYGWAVPNPEHVRAIERIGSSDDYAREEIDRFVFDHTDPEDYVLVWGYEVRVNVLASRRTPSRFLYAYPLLVDSGPDDHDFDRFFADLEEHPPALICIREDDELALYLLDLEPAPCIDCTAPVREDLEQFSRWIASRYSEVHAPEEWIAFRRNTE